MLLKLFSIEEDYGNKFAWSVISDGICDCLIVLLLLIAWRIRKRKFKKGILFGTVSVELFFVMYYTYGSGYVTNALGFLFLLMPGLTWSLSWKLKRKMEKKKAEAFCLRILVSAVILTAACAVGFNDFRFWFDGCLITAVVILEVWICIRFAFMEYEREKERNRMLWREWLGLFLFSFVASSLLQDGNPLSWLYLNYFCWGRALSVAMPILFAVLYRWLRDRAWSQTLNLALYYVVCMLVF